MTYDPSRLLTQLLNTNLQGKDPQLYQLIRDLIGALASLDGTVSAIGGSVTNVTNNNIIGNPSSLTDGNDNSTTELLSIPGRDGISGKDGSIGIPGIDGIDGEDAPIIIGPIGITGATGPAGPQGLSGFDGVDGEDSFPIPGPQGPTGNTGNQGVAGPVGFGVDGIDGEDSFRIPGVQGPQGNPGVTGPPGLGVPGNDGYDGDDAFPIPGPVGPRGDTGLNGTIGVPGYDGIDGDDAFTIPGPRGLEGPMVPQHLLAGDTFTVPQYKQALFSMTIDNEGIIVVDGFLVEVDSAYTPAGVSVLTEQFVFPSVAGNVLLFYEVTEFNNGFVIGVGIPTTLTVLESGLYIIELVLNAGQATVGPTFFGTIQFDAMILNNGVVIPYANTRATLNCPDNITVRTSIITRLTAGDVIKTQYSQDNFVTNTGIITLSPTSEPVIPAARLMIQKIGD